MTNPEPLIPLHGGYKNLKSFQIAQLIYDVTVRFCDKYISKFSRTHDQMVQAARSGVQNIAEGSLASGTSKKTELKLTNVARASLGELKLDYEDFLRQKNLPEWPPEHPVLLRFKALCGARPWHMCRRGWLLRSATRTYTDPHRQALTKRGRRMSLRASPCKSVKVRAGPCLYPRQQALLLPTLPCHCLTFAFTCWPSKSNPRPPPS